MMLIYLEIALIVSILIVNIYMVKAQRVKSQKLREHKLIMDVIASQAKPVRVLNIPHTQQSKGLPKDISSFGVNPSTVIDCREFSLDKEVPEELHAFLEEASNTGNARGLDIISVVKNELTKIAEKSTIYIVLTTTGRSDQIITFVSNKHFGT